MICIRTRRRTRHAHPMMEALEDRKLLYATLGASFTYGSRITYSFAPDGTNIGGNSSALFSTMTNKGFTTTQWQTAFQKAAAAWEAAANINLALVPDDGSSFGGSGNQQGDTHFGDIRIGGSALSSGVLATCFLPPAFNGGTLAGDMVINTTQTWQIGSDYDLQTVAIHEFGHALGLDHSSISTADMYASYNAQKQSLTSDDASGIQAVWGARQPDAFDSATSNNAYTTATNINSYINSSAQASIPSIDITNSTDSDWFVVNAPANTSGTLTITMQSTNLSSLSPKVTLYSSSLATLATASAANVYGATVTTSAITGVMSGQKFYIKCAAANGGTSGIGAYGLQINFGSGTMSHVPPPNTVVASGPDQGGGSTNEDAAVGKLLAAGDSLAIDKHFQQALEIVDGGWSVAELGLPPAEAWAITKINDAWQAIKLHGKDSAALRSAVIQAIDDVLEAWDRH